MEATLSACHEVAWGRAVGPRKPLDHFTYTHAPYKTGLVRKFCELHPSECKALRWQKEARKVGKLMTDHATGLTWRFDATMSELGYGEQKAQQMLDVIQVIYKSNVWRLDLRFGQLLLALESAGLTDDTIPTHSSSTPTRGLNDHLVGCGRR